MAHYATLDNTNKVTNVIVGLDEESTVDMEQYYSDLLGSRMLRTSYNTKGNSHKTEGRTPFRGNYALIGSTYDPTADVFIDPKPFESWVLNTTNYVWEAPTPHGDPEDGAWIWSETANGDLKEGWNLITLPE
tara:strand:- start:394 stop:789 length:396 start_codon:yes stop_codon:yes gene_type:complete